MDRKRAKELLPIITAFAEGKKIQVHGDTSWIDATEPKFDRDYEYRIKPEEDVEKQLINTSMRYARYLTIEEWIELYNKANAFKQDEECQHDFGDTYGGGCRKCGIRPIDYMRYRTDGGEDGAPLPKMVKPQISHKDIMRMWWRRKGQEEWFRVISYISLRGLPGEYGFEFNKNEAYTAEQLLETWEYAVVPPEE